MRHRTGSLATALAVASLVGCSSFQRARTPGEGVARAKSGEIRVNKVDGSIVPLVNASIVGDSLIGISPRTGARIAIPTSAIASVESKDIDAGRTALLGGGIILGLAAVAGVIALVAIVVSAGR